MRRAVMSVMAVACVATGLGCGGTHEDRVRAWEEAFDEGGSGSGRRVGETEVWTIECNSYKGSRREAMADGMAKALKRVRQLRPKDVWVEHGDEQSCVYYGQYKLKYVEAQVGSDTRSRGDAYVKLNKEIRRDLQFIKTLAVGEKHPFLQSRPIPKPLENVGPSEWDLREAKGVYSLQVGVTYNTPTLHNYKKAALDWVRVLRKEGHEAYYYHDPDEPRSCVYVGTFGENALIEWHESVPHEETGTLQSVRRARYSDAVKALRAQADFRYNLENGHRMYRKMRNEKTGETARMPNGSFLVKIPRREASDGDETEW